MKKILIWGTGKIGESVYEQGINGTIIGFIETYRGVCRFKDLPVYQVTTDKLPNYDYIIVANTHTIEVYSYINSSNLDLDKIIFLCYCPLINQSEKIDMIEEVLGYKVFQRYCTEYRLLEKSFYAEDKKLYSQLNKRKQFEIQDELCWPVMKDKYGSAGTIHNYFGQDLWAACLIHRVMPQTHYDIGSRLDGFIAHILAMGIPVKMIDIRPFPKKITGLETIVDDATYLRQFEDNSVESLSALCSLEHFSLGRYGDPIDPEACFKCFKAIQSKLKKGGHLYLSVPVGRERLEFNAHRIFFASTIIDQFSFLKLEEYACVSQGEIEHDVEIHKYDDDFHNGEWRYGLFHFIK